MPRTEIDKVTARELELSCDNYGPSTSQQIYNLRNNIRKNFIKRMKNSTYDRDKAPKGWMPLVDACAKQYAKEHASPGDWHRIFNAQTRRAVAASYADEFEREYSAGAFGAASASTWVFGGLMAAGLGLVGVTFWLIKKGK